MLRRAAGLNGEVELPEGANAEPPVVAADVHDA
jgi:hypothetical protein